MYTTGQLAKKCNISIRTIQYYDRRGLLHAKRTEKSDCAIIMIKTLNNFKKF